MGQMAAAEAGQWPTAGAGPGPVEVRAGDDREKDRQTGKTERQRRMEIQERQKRERETEERETERGMRGRQRVRGTQWKGHTAGPGQDRWLLEPLSLELSVAGILRTVKRFQCLTLKH